jgi:hypothetical protein
VWGSNEISAGKHEQKGNSAGVGTDDGLILKCILKKYGVNM